MLKRRAYSFLDEWRRTKKNECLLIKSARQIGKTFLVRQFGKENYESFIELNFEKEPELKSAFDGNLDVPNIIKEISLRKPGIKIVPHKTLLFF